MVTLCKYISTFHACSSFLVKCLIISTVIFAVFLSLTLPVHAAKCLFISSYHSGYEWNDGIERGIESVLKGKCELDKFYLDTKRNKREDFGKQAALRAKAYIESSKPDILIAADDNASRYLILPYFKNVKMPVVFCGINYTVEPYGYPYTNATGMIEISPVKTLFKYVEGSIKQVRWGTYLASDVISQHKEFELNHDIYAKQGIVLTPIFVKSMREWMEAYIKVQKTSDFLILGNNGGLEDWDKELVANFVAKEGNILSVTNYDWMIRYAMLAVSKVAEEQGEWAAKVVLAVLGGVNISDIPIIVNRRWGVQVNMSLLTVSRIKLSPSAMLHAKRMSF